MEKSKSRTGILVGQHKHHSQCRFCLNETMKPFIDFGYVPLAGGFHKADSKPSDLAKEQKYPLPIQFCETCSLVQVNNAVSGETLFQSGYFYFSSAIKTLANHFAQYAEDLSQIFPNTAQTKILELGCNDGVLLKPLLAKGFQAVGIDPATNVVAPLIKDGMRIYNDFFTEATAGQIQKEFGSVDAILTSNSFAHIDDMHDVMKGVKLLLKPEGFLAFEVHYLGILLKEMQYDMMYHEHISYYSLSSIDYFANLFGMEVFDIKMIPIHAGSIRFCLQNKKTGTRKVTDAVHKLREEERVAGFDRFETYQTFGRKVEKTKTDLLSILAQIKKEGKTVAGYGASGRATAMSAYCGLDKNYLSMVIDDAPAKQGAFTPGNHIRIQGSDILKSKDRPDYVLLFAWSFAKEIISKSQDYLQAGGKFIVPLPEVKVIGN